MKTKNIFRMLIVAAALLMGANNVKAEGQPFFLQTILKLAIIFHSIMVYLIMHRQMTN